MLKTTTNTQKGFLNAIGNALLYSVSRDMSHVTNTASDEWYVEDFPLSGGQRGDHNQSRKEVDHPLFVSLPFSSLFC